MDQRDFIDYIFYLICLEMSNHMPIYRKNFIVLVQNLLHLVLSDIRNSRTDRFVDLLSRPRLCHRTEKNVLRVPAAADGRLCLFVLYLLNVFRYRAHFFTCHDRQIVSSFILLQYIYG